MNGQQPKGISHAPLLLAILLVPFAVGLMLEVDLRSPTVLLNVSESSAPWETVWGVVSSPLVAFHSLFDSLPTRLARNTQSAFLAASLVVYSMLAISRGWSPWGLVVHLCLFPWVALEVVDYLGSGGPSLGVEVFVFGLLLIAYSISSDVETKVTSIWKATSRFASFVLGLVLGMGGLYLLCLAPTLKKFRLDRFPHKTIFCIGALSPSLAFAIQRIRYPNPDLPALENIWSELAGSWLFGKTILDDSFGGPLGFFPFRFPGLKLGLAWLLSLGFVRLCGSVWRAGAGRTVPAQVVLYLLPVLYLALLCGGYRFGREADSQEKPLSLEERLNYARALHETLPPETILYGPRETYDAVVYLRACEGVRNRVNLEPGGKPFWTREAINPEIVRPPFARSVVAYSEGKNWLGIAGEPVEFAPQHLLGATEVYMASPTFFIGATPPPQLTFKETPFLPKKYPAPDLTDWGFDGGHYYLFRERSNPIWRPLGEGWEVHYFGFLLAGDLDRWNRRLPLATSMRFEEFYD